MPYSNVQSQVWKTKKRAPLNDHAIPYSIHHGGNSVLSGKDKWNWVILWRIPHSCNGSRSLRNSVSKIAGRWLTRKRLYKPLFPKSNNKKEIWFQTSFIAKAYPNYSDLDLSIYSLTTSLIASTSTLNLWLSSARSFSITCFCLVKNCSFSIISFATCFLGLLTSEKGKSVQNSNFITISPFPQILSQTPFCEEEIVLILFQEKISVLYSNRPSQRNNVTVSLDKIKQSKYKLRKSTIRLINRTSQIPPNIHCQYGAGLVWLSKAKITYNTKRRTIITNASFK